MKKYLNFWGIFSVLSFFNGIGMINIAYKQYDFLQRTSGEGIFCFFSGTIYLIVSIFLIVILTKIKT